MNPNLITALGIFSSLLSLLLGGYVLWRKSAVAAALPFALLMAANAVYAAAYTTEINADSLEAVVFWLKMEYLGVSFIPVCWYLFADAYAADRKRVRPVRVLLMLVIPVLTILLMGTNEAHQAVYTDIRLRTGLSLSLITARRGWWYWVSAAYFYVLLLLGSLKVLRHAVGSSGVYRAQYVTIILGLVFPWLGHIALILRVSPYGMDITPFTLSLSGALLAMGVFRWGLFELSPIARERVMEAIRDGVIVVDLKNRLVDANRAAKALFPQLAQLEPGRDLGPFFESLNYHRELGNAELSMQIEDAVRHFRFNSEPIEDARGMVIGQVVIVVDTTENSELLFRLARLATTDELTGAANRRHFFELAGRELARAQRSSSPLSFAMFDLDHFKQVNDTYGHAAGDRALVAVCDVCRGMLRASDLLCRYGGEEFIIIFPDAAPAAAAEVAERLRKRIAEQEIVAGTARFRVTVSFGIDGTGGAPRESLEQYLKRIDDAMYAAKEQGRNRVVQAERIST